MTGEIKFSFVIVMGPTQLGSNLTSVLFATQFAVLTSLAGRSLAISGRPQFGYFGRRGCSLAKVWLSCYTLG